MDSIPIGSLQKQARKQKASVRMMEMGKQMNLQDPETTASVSLSAPSDEHARKRGRLQQMENLAGQTALLEGRQAQLVLPQQQRTPAPVPRPQPAPQQATTLAQGPQPIATVPAPSLIQQAFQHVATPEPQPTSQLAPQQATTLGMGPQPAPQQVATPEPQAAPQPAPQQATTPAPGPWPALQQVATPEPQPTPQLAPHQHHNRFSQPLNRLATGPQPPQPQVATPEPQPARQPAPQQATVEAPVTQPAPQEVAEPETQPYPQPAPQQATVEAPVTQPAPQQVAKPETEPAPQLAPEQATTSASSPQPAPEQVASLEPQPASQPAPQQATAPAPITQSAPQQVATPEAQTAPQLALERATTSESASGPQPRPASPMQDLCPTCSRPVPNTCGDGNPDDCQCPRCICLELLSTEVCEALPCGHTFHKACLGRWIQISGKNLGSACPHKCNQDSIQSAEDALLSLASTQSQSAQGESQGEPLIRGDWDADEQQIFS